MPESIITDCAYVTQLKPHHTHFHMSYELIYVKKGHIKLNINENEYEITDNTIIIINCFEEHSIEILSDIYERYFVNFSREKIDKVLNSPHLISILRNRPIGFKHCAIPPKNTEDIFKIFIEEHNDTTQDFSQEFALCKLKELLISIFRENHSNFPNLTNPIKPAIFQIQNYIEKNFSEDIEITVLAEKFFINKYYLSHSFKEAIGYSPKQYLLLNRLSYAKLLLCDSTLNISEIAIKSGFHDANNFIRTFKKELGITPHKYRNNS